MDKIIIEISIGCENRNNKLFSEHIKNIRVSLPLYDNIEYYIIPIIGNETRVKILNQNKIKDEYYIDMKQLLFKIQILLDEKFK